MARRKKKEDTTLVPGEKQEPAIPNRYGAQGISNEDHEPCCCHLTPLSDLCSGCESLRKTERQPTLVGVMIDDVPLYDEVFDIAHPRVDRALEDADTIDDPEDDAEEEEDQELAE